MTDDRPRREADGNETIATGAGQVVRSPELVALELPVAGPTTRMLAYVIDWAVILVLEMGLVGLLFLALPASARALFGWLVARLPGDPRELADRFMLVLVVLFVLLQVVFETFYFVFCEMTTGGRSVGKAVVGLRVVRDGGFALSLRDSLVRNLLRVVDLLPGGYAVGLMAMVMSPETKRLGDLAAGTIVVRLDRPMPAPPLAAVAPDSASAFRFERGQVERLGRNELALVRQTLRRVATLSPERADEALARAVTVLCARIGHAPVAPEERAAFLHALLDAARAR